MSREVIEQHGTTDVHRVRSLAHYDAVFGQELRNVVERCVVVHGQSGLESKSLWDTIMVHLILKMLNSQLTCLQKASSHKLTFDI